MQILEIIALILGYVCLGVISFAVVISFILFIYVIAEVIIEHIKYKINTKNGSNR